MEQGTTNSGEASVNMRKIPVGTLFIVAAVLFFLAAIANPANRAVYISLGVVFMILSISRRKKQDRSG